MSGAIANWDREYKKLYEEMMKNGSAIILKPKRNMYKAELDDLEVIYKATGEELQTQVEANLPYLLHYMEEFITLHKQNEVLNEKLEELLKKRAALGGEDE
jgi:hypothetical protein